MPTIRFKQRSDNPGWAGQWEVSWYTPDGKRHQKTFPSYHHDAALDLLAVIKEKYPRRRARFRNTSPGKHPVGVCPYRSKNTGDILSWQCRIRLRGFESRQYSFTVKQYGERIAYKLALKLREEWLADPVRAERWFYIDGNKKLRKVIPQDIKEEFDLD